MGKLKTKLGELSKHISALTAKHLNTTGELKAQLDTLHNQFGVLSEGTNALYMYFAARFKDKKDSIANHPNATIKEMMDNNAAGMIKQLMTSKSACQLCGRTIQGIYATKLPMLIKNCDDPLAAIKEIKMMIVARQARKWKTPMFKDKLKKYAGQIDQLEKDLAATKAAATQKAKKMPGIYATLLKNYVFTPDTTMENIRKDMITADLNGNMQALDTDWKDAVETDKKVALGRVEKQLKDLAAWANEADAMEAESEEK